MLILIIALIFVAVAFIIGLYDTGCKKVQHLDNQELFAKTAKKIIDGGDKKKMTAADKAEAMANGLELDPKASGYINPLFRVAFTYKGEALTELPFALLCHAYLKDYGFDPDAKIDGLKIRLTLAPDNWTQIPMFTKHKVTFNDQFTAEEAKKKGLLDGR